MNQMPLVFDAAFVVVDQIGGVRNRIRGFGQALLNFRASPVSNFSASRPRVGKGQTQPTATRADVKVSPIVRRFEPQPQAKRGALVHLKFHVAGPVSRLRAGNRDFRENLAGLQIAGVRARDQFADRAFPGRPPRSPILTVPPRTRSSVAGSECGSAKQRLPPSVPVARTRTFATCDSISARTG